MVKRGWNASVSVNPYGHDRSADSRSMSAFPPLRERIAVWSLPRLGPTVSPLVRSTAHAIVWSVVYTVGRFYGLDVSVRFSLATGRVPLGEAPIGVPGDSPAARRFCLAVPPHAVATDDPNRSTSGAKISAHFRQWRKPPAMPGV